ncbi:MAG: hypothetical protein IK025_07025 [Bacteroidales bacterium]|nr:hypothetical protein [Bacteroidales bacterium]
MDKQVNIILSLIGIIILMSCNDGNINGNIDNKSENDTTQLVQETDSVLVADSIKEDTVKMVQYSKEEVDKFVDSIKAIKEGRSVFRSEHILLAPEYHGFSFGEIAHWMSFVFDSVYNYIKVCENHSDILGFGNYKCYNFDNNGNCYYIFSGGSVDGEETYLVNNQVIYSEGYSEEYEYDSYCSYNYEIHSKWSLYKEQTLRNYQFVYIDSKQQICFYDSKSMSSIATKERYNVLDLFLSNDGEKLFYIIKKGNDKYYRKLDLSMHSVITNTFAMLTLNKDVLEYGASWPSFNSEDEEKEYNRKRDSVYDLKMHHPEKIIDYVTSQLVSDSTINNMKNKCFKQKLDENVSVKITLDNNKIYYNDGKDKICLNDKLGDFNEIVNFNVLCVSNKKESILYSAVDSQGEGSVFFATLDGKVQFKLDGCDCNRHNAGFLNDDNIIFNNDKGIHLMKANTSKIIKTFSGQKFVIINR